MPLSDLFFPGSCHPFLEHIGYTANFAIPMLGAWWMGTNSKVLIYAYLLGFDFLNAWGHCNFEIVPYWCALPLPIVKAHPILFDL